MIEIYYKPVCLYSINAIRIFDRHHMHYTLYDVTDNRRLKKEMVNRSNGNITVPQIFIDNVYIGGYTELSHLEFVGKL